MNNFDEDIIQLVQELNNKLKIDHKNWHRLKGKKLNRSAELISDKHFFIFTYRNNIRPLNFFTNYRFFTFFNI